MEEVYIFIDVCEVEVVIDYGHLFMLCIFSWSVVWVLTYVYLQNKLKKRKKVSLCGVRTVEGTLLLEWLKINIISAASYILGNYLNVVLRLLLTF
jgi:hypothetical protein